MANARIVWKPDALYKLRSQPGVVADLEARARRVQSAAESSGGKYTINSQQGAKNPSGRWRVSVTTGDWRARRNTARNGDLLRAVQAGG